jgi:hypothetical protein
MENFLIFYSLWIFYLISFKLIINKESPRGKFFKVLSQVKNQSQTRFNSTSTTGAATISESKPINDRTAWFFGIGINEYSSNDWGNLRTAVSDVEAIGNLLKDCYGFVNFNEEEPLINKNATRENIFSRIREFENKVKENDSLIFLFSGHGHLYNDNKSSYWVPYDAEPETDGKKIIHEEILKLILGLKCLHILLISDSCFAGGLEKTRGANFEIKEDPEKKSRLILFSSRQDELAYDGNGDHSPFAEAILSVLRLNKDEQLTAYDFSQKVRTEFEKKYKNLNQRPDFFFPEKQWHENGTFNLRKTKDFTPGLSSQSRVLQVIKSFFIILYSSFFWSLAILIGKGLGGEAWLATGVIGGLTSGYISRSNWRNMHLYLRKAHWILYMGLSMIVGWFITYLLFTSGFAIFDGDFEYFLQGLIGSIFGLFVFTLLIKVTIGKKNNWRIVASDGFNWLGTICIAWWIIMSDIITDDLFIAVLAGMTISFFGVIMTIIDKGFPRTPKG